MMTMTTGYKTLWSATAEWLEFVAREGEIVTDPFEGTDEEWHSLLDGADEAARQYGWAHRLDRGDNELWACVIVEVADRHSLLRPGDVLVSAGTDDVLFLRPETR